MDKATIIVPMTLSQIFEYHKIQIDKLRTEKDARKQKLIRGRIELSEMILDTAFAETIESESSTLAKRVNLALYDIEALASVLPESQQKQLLALPKGTQFELELQTTAPDTNVEDIEATIIIGPGKEKEKIIKDILKLMERGFVDNIETAVEKLKQIDEYKNIMPSEGWKAISQIADEAKISLAIRKGYNRMIATYYAENPIKAYYQVRKHFKTWSDSEIGRFIEFCIRAHAQNPETSFMEGGELCKMIDNSPSRYLVKWSQNQEIANKALELFAEHMPGKTTQGKIKNILSLVCPKDREKIEKHYGRKAYVEEGYHKK